MATGTQREVELCPLPSRRSCLPLPSQPTSKTPTGEQGLEVHSGEGVGSEVQSAFGLKSKCQYSLVIEKLSLYLIYQKRQLPHLYNQR